MIPGGAWFGPDKPNYGIVMQPVAKKMNQLTEGKVFNTAEGGRLIKVFPLGFTTDNPAKDILLNKIGFNGIHGCGYCDQMGNFQKNLFFSQNRK